MIFSEFSGYNNKFFLIEILVVHLTIKFLCYNTIIRSTKFILKYFMLGYPYTYSDYLSEEEAMQRRVDLFDKVVGKGLILTVFWSVWALIPILHSQTIRL